MTDRGDIQRLDQWLTFARIVKTRTIARKMIEAGHVRINREKKRQVSAGVKQGDVLTITMRREVLVLEVHDLGERRGPPSQARALYRHLNAQTPYSDRTTDRDEAQTAPSR